MNSLHPLIAGLLPEAILLVAAALVILVGLVSHRGSANTPLALALLAVLAALWAAWELSSAAPHPTVSILQDQLVWFARLLGLSMGALILLANRHVPEPGLRAEFFALILCSLAGVLIVSLANDLILLFLGLELVSVPTYILVGLSRRDIRAQEAAAKYFFLGAFAAALTLYGFSFLYGAAGTMQLFSVPDSPRCLTQLLSQGTAAGDPLVLVGLVLSLAGLAFKIAAVPLHAYVADVYQGAASPVAGLLGFVPKFAGIIGLIRVLSLTGWLYGDAFFWLLWVLAALTMTVGNTLALMQHNVKRMLAYSSIAHSGYILVAILAGPAVGPAATHGPWSGGLAGALFYMTIYGLANLGAFATLAYLRRSGAVDEPTGETGIETLEELSGCARAHPWAALGLSLCVLSLMGLPPAAGLLGKVYIFGSALSMGGDGAHAHAMLALVVIGVVNSAIAAAYYLRIVASCYTMHPADDVRLRPASCGALRLCMFACAVLMLLIFAWPAKLYDQTRHAADSVAAVLPATERSLTASR